MSEFEVSLYEKFEKWAEIAMPNASEEERKAAIASYVYLLMSR